MLFPQHLLPRRLRDDDHSIQFLTFLDKRMFLTLPGKGIILPDKWLLPVHAHARQSNLHRLSPRVPCHQDNTR